MEAILKINNDFSYLITRNDKIKELLWSKLRFRQRNFQHTRAWKQKKWDGFINFFNKDNGKFLTGLLPEIRVALNYCNIDYQTIDEREDFNFLHSSIDQHFMKSYVPPGEPDTLYDYQVELVNQTIKNKRGIVMAPTGAGKTLVFISLLRALPPKTPVLFLANRKNLISQNYNELIKWKIPNVGRFYSDYHEPNIVTCSTVQSAHLLEKMLPKFKVVVADEIHLLSSPISVKIFKKLTSAVVRVAVSATPYKFGGKDDVQKYMIKGYFGPIFKINSVEGGVLKTSHLQERENISASECVFYYIDEPNNIEYDVYLDAVTNGIANNWHFHKIASDLAKMQKGRTLILVERLSHGDSLNSLIPNSLWVRGKDNDETRNYVIDKLQTAKENVVAIATRYIFDTGINFKVHNVIDCCINSPEHGIIQLIGRGLRLASDKEKLRYYSFIHRTNPYLYKHSMTKVRVLKKEKHKIEIKDTIDF